ncbi:hypothetical protein [Pollutibacter soli]|uniref:hypothetical protein n=1 Tax=Pollutibacter soli TaxID=3034157 RepID=UPI003013BFF0
MAKLFILIVIFCFVTSCNQQPKSTTGKEQTTSDVTLNHSNPVKTDSARLNIDGFKISPDNFKLLLENEHVRVLEYTLKPGAKDEPHTHPAKSSYVVSGGKIKVYLENGETMIFDEKAGTANWSDYVGKHHVENIGNSTVRIIITEIKALQ